jgi:hypothetical protein
MATASVGFEQRKLSYIKIFTKQKPGSNHEIFSDEIIDKLLDKVLMHNDNFFVGKLARDIFTCLSRMTNLDLDNLFFG